MKTYDESEDLKHSDTEITLGLKSILGIFFALALICGVFFGFGYSLGRGNGPKTSTAAQSAQHLAATPSAAAPDIKTVVESASGTTTKPAAGEPAAAPSLNAATVTPASTAQPATSPAPQPAASAVPPQPVPAAYSLPAQAPASANIMVQIAAVAHRNDANVLVNALQQRGYQASVRTEPGDQLLHVQIGPFATRAQAKAMQARLLNDGYNAILK